MKEQVVKQGLRVDLCIGSSKVVGAGRKADLSAVDAIAQGTYRKSVNRHEYTARWLAQCHCEVA